MIRALYRVLNNWSASHNIADTNPKLLKNLDRIIFLNINKGKKLKPKEISQKSKFYLAETERRA